MGQKVNPFIFRVILNRNWDCLWYTKKKNFSLYLVEDLKIRSLLNIIFSKIPLVKIIIQKNKINVFIIIYVKNRSSVISNKKINLLILEKFFFDFFKKNFFIEIKSVLKHEISPFLIFLKIKKKIEERKSYKNIIRNLIYNAFKLKARGIRIIIQGRINGSIMTKKQVFQHGRMPLTKIIANIRYYAGHVVTIFGSIGIKIWIYLGDYIYF